MLLAFSVVFKFLNFYSYVVSAFRNAARKQQKAMASSTAPFLGLFCRFWVTSRCPEDLKTAYNNPLGHERSSRHFSELKSASGKAFRAREQKWQKPNINFI